MLNPDGVVAGKYRTDLDGTDLNRCYHRATHEAHPSIAAALAVATQLSESGGLFAYVDVHAHAVRTCAPAHLRTCAPAHRRADARARRDCC